MIIFLYGQDSYRLKQNSSIVLDNYRKKYPGGIFYKFDLSVPGEIAKVEDAVKGSSLFGGVKLIVIKNSFANKADSDRVEKLIKTQNLLKEKNTVLLLLENQEEKELAKNRTLFNLLAGAGNVVRNIEYLEGENLKKWIKNEFSLRKCSIEPDGLRELIAAAGNESWALMNEIDKLCNLKVGGVIKKEDVALLGYKKLDLNIFDFVDAIAGKNKPKAYEILFKEIHNGRDPYYILTMMVYGFRNLLAVKDLSDRGMSLDSITKKARLHPFVAKKTYQSAGKFKLGELKDIYSELLEMDTLSKNGGVNLADAILGFIIS